MILNLSLCCDHDALSRDLKSLISPLYQDVIDSPTWKAFFSPLQYESKKTQHKKCSKWAEKIPLMQTTHDGPIMITQCVNTHIFSSIFSSKIFIYSLEFSYTYMMCISWHLGERSSSDSCLDFYLGPLFQFILTCSVFLPVSMLFSLLRLCSII